MSRKQAMCGLGRMGLWVFGICCLVIEKFRCNKSLFLVFGYEKKIDYEYVIRFPAYTCNITSFC